MGKECSMFFTLPSVLLNKNLPSYGRNRGAASNLYHLTWHTPSPYLMLPSPYIHTFWRDVCMHVYIRRNERKLILWANKEKKWNREKDRGKQEGKKKKKGKKNEGGWTRLFSFLSKSSDPKEQPETLYTIMKSQHQNEKPK